MKNPFTDYKNHFENRSTSTDQSYRSDCNTFMLKTFNTTVPAFSRPALVPLVLADNFSLSCTNTIPFQTKTNINATANPYPTLYQQHSAPNIGPSASLPSSYSFPTVIPENFSPVKT